MNSIVVFGQSLPQALANIIILVAGIGLGLLIHLLLFRVLGRLVRRTPGRTDDILVEHARRPARWIIVAVTLSALRPVFILDADANAVGRQVAGLLIPALVGWLAVSMLYAVQRLIDLRADISVADNLKARRARTRNAILTRIGVIGIGFITICVMLLSIPGVRSVGVTLMASAGLAGLAVGAAAQPALKNLIAGIQMAFTEPIRIDDVVIMDGEWGRIEEIRLTFVVVRIWDERRLIVPVSKFLESSFQNWTRETSQLMGAVFWQLDPAADIDRLRAHMESVVRASERWDGRFCNMVVTDTKPDSIEVRGLMTAKDAGTAFDLRCEVREAVLKFIRTEMPEALPRTRALLVDRAAAGRSAPDAEAGRTDGGGAVAVDAADADGGAAMTERPGGR